MMFNAEELIKAARAEVFINNTKGKMFNISTDTRTIKAGDIYLPLKGETFNGEDFIKQALESGACGYFTTDDVVYSQADLVLKVEDAMLAYLNIAKFLREKINPITIGITGSSGKTTTKEMVYSVVSRHYKTQKTLSNHNNEIGFCQTVLGMEDDTQALIVEMGMRGLGEIDLISRHLEPDYAVITNCGTAHVGRLGSLDNIAVAKCEIANGLNPKGVFISPEQEIIKKHLNFSGEKVFYKLSDVEVLERRASYTKFKYKDVVYELNVEGDYNIENSLSAIEIGLKLSIPTEKIQKGLKLYHPIEKRWEIEHIGDLNFINDSYNANPESMKASVKTFVDLYHNPVVVLGDMGELGENEGMYHRQVGQYLSSLNKKVRYITVGALAGEIGQVLEHSGFDVHKCHDVEQAGCYILENFDGSNTIFLKASRSMKFERILETVKRGICK